MIRKFLLAVLVFVATILFAQLAYSGANLNAVGLDCDIESFDSKLFSYVNPYSLIKWLKAIDFEADAELQNEWLKLRNKLPEKNKWLVDTWQAPGDGPFYDALSFKKTRIFESGNHLITKEYDLVIELPFSSPPVLRPMPIWSASTTYIFYYLNDEEPSFEKFDNNLDAVPVYVDDEVVLWLVRFTDMKGDESSYIHDIPGTRRGGSLRLDFIGTEHILIFDSEGRILIHVSSTESGSQYLVWSYYYADDKRAQPTRMLVSLLRLNLGEPSPLEGSSYYLPLNLGGTIEYHANIGIGVLDNVWIVESIGVSHGSIQDSDEVFERARKPVIVFEDFKWVKPDVEKNPYEDD
ncbi:hypothetical protein J7K50_01325 [bacterium]|nr:hypothetical protein [bacterium]